MTATSTLRDQDKANAVERPAAESDTYLIPLGEASRFSNERVGAKAANLGSLVDQGFLIPDGVVLTTGAFDEFAAINNLEAESTVQEATTAYIPKHLVNEMKQTMEMLGDVPLAVRSSGAAEDSQQSSFAGQYETTLNVRGLDALREAVQRCWASAFSENVSQYRAMQGESGIRPMAVLIQRMVPAQVAGVAFTTNPVTGDDGEVLVSAVRGLGDRLVSGEATPDEWIVRDGLAVEQNRAEGVLDADQAIHIAVTSRTIEKHFGAPQDVEWAMTEGELYILQARPITTMSEIEPLKPDFEIPDGFWVRDSGHFSKPVSPMLGSFYGWMAGKGLSAALTEFGLMLERVDIKEIGGWNYLRIVPIGGKEAPAPPWWMVGIVARIHPAMRKVVGRAREAARNDLGGTYIERWWNEWRDEFQGEISKIQQVELTALTDAQLEGHLDRLLGFMERGWLVHAQLSVPYMQAVSALVFFCRDTLGWDTGKIAEMMSGLSEMSTEPARQLAKLAEKAQNRPATLQLLNDIDRTTPERLAEADPEFAAAFEAYQRTFGIRTLSEDVADPTFAEKPEFTLALLKGQMGHGHDPVTVANKLEARRVLVVDEARSLLVDSPDQLAVFDRFLARAERAYPVREDKVFLTYYAPSGLMRQAIQEVGRRLALRSVIVEPDDVFFLRMEEALEALHKERSFQELVLLRKRERLWQEANVGPDHYGEDPGPPPDLRALPKEARQAMESLLWFFENDVDAPTADGGERVHGIAASAGQYTGTVRVVRDESDFGKLRPGDVLVCPITTSAWSAIFSNIGALVTDAGGVLSHPAIIAREYGIPAVLATGNATSNLHDGQLVTVDGTSGQVQIKAP